MVLGIYLGVKICNTSFFKPKAKLERVNKENLPLNKQSLRTKLYFNLGILLFIAFLVWVFYLVFTNGNISTQNKQSLLALALIFGFVFGFVISKGKFVLLLALEIYFYLVEIML